MGNLTGLGAQGTPHSQLQRQYGIRVAVADAVAATVEGADVVLHRGGAEKVACQRRAAGHQGALCIVQRF